MSSISDFLPLSSNESSVNNIPSTPNTFEPVVSTQNSEDVTSSNFSDYLQAPSLETKMTPSTFDWDKTQADRFTQSSHFGTEGFNPYATPEVIGGKTYDANELKYAGMQTWGDVMSNAVGGAWGLAKNTFVEGWKGWGNMGSALFNWGSDQTFMQRLEGSPEELMQKDEEQKAIFNKYAIFKSPIHDTNFGVFNREFLGDMVQQSGFSIGAGAQFLSEMLLTWGVGEGLGAVAKSSGWLAKGIAGAEDIKNTISQGERAKQVASTSEIINAGRKAGDPTAMKSFSKNLWDYSKQAAEWSTNQFKDVTGIKKMTNAYEAGASTYQLTALGVGGVTRMAAALNSAATEARFEAANTYGQMYGDLINEWQEKHNGEMPVGKDLRRIQKLSYAASTDNFGANTALLMTMNQLEFGNIMSKFGSSSRLMREALETGEGELFSITGKLRREITDGALKEGQKATQAYTKGMFGAISNFNTIRKDFGLGTALWQVGKRSGKIEISEGIQEILQNASDNTFTDYYKNLYHGNKDINGSNFFSAIGENGWKSLQGQWSMEGWQTFLMGAATGLLISPMQSGIMGGFKKANAGINERYKGEVDAHKAMLNDAKQTLNTWYNDPKKALSEHIAGIKVQGKADQNMMSSLVDGDKYEFNNAKDDAFTKAVAVAIKTGNYKSFIESITEFGDRLTDDQFEEAFGLKSSTENKTSAKGYTQKIVSEIENYYDNHQSLMDEFGHLVQPELYAHSPEEYAKTKMAKKSLDDAIELLATTSYHATNTIKRATEIRSEASSLPSIGSSANKAFEVLGNIANAHNEKGRLIEQLETYKGLAGDKDIDKKIVNTKEQLKHVVDWINNYERLEHYKSENNKPENKQQLPLSNPGMHTVMQNMINAHTGYLTAVNNEFEKVTNVPDRREMTKSFNLLMDYIKLNRDHGEYVSALNVLSDPRGFNLLYNRIKEAMRKAKATIHLDHFNEVKERVSAVTDISVEDMDIEEPEETKTDDRIPESVLPAKIKEEIITYYGEPAYIAVAPGSYGPNPKRVLSAETKEWFDQNDELMNKLEIVYDNSKKGKIAEPEVIAIIKEPFAAEKPESEEDKAKRLEKEKAIAKTAEKKKLQAEWAKQLDENRKKYPHTPQKPLSDADLALREKNEKEINAKYTKLISDLDVKPTGSTTISELVLTPEEEKAIGATKKGGKWYLDDKFDEPVEEGYIRELLDAYNTTIGKGETGTTEEKPEVVVTKTSLENLPKMEILDSQISIGAHRLENIKGGYVDTKEQAEKRLANTLAPLSQSDLDEGLSMVVTTRPKGELKQPIAGNLVVFTKPQTYSIQLRYNDEPIGYLTNADYYVFKIDGEELSPLDLSIDQFEKLIKIPEGKLLLQAFTEFQEDFKTATTIQLAIEKQLAEGKNTFSGTELQELVSIRPVITLDFVNAEDPRAAPLLEDIEANTNIPVSESGEKRMIVVNNARYKEITDQLKATGEFTTVSSSEYAPMVLGEMSDLDTTIIKSAGDIPLKDNNGMYSVAIEVAGQIKWIQVTPTVYNESQMQETLDRIKELSSKEDKKRTEEDNQEISTLLKGIFIALPVHVWTEGSKIGKNELQKWDLRLNYNPKENTIFLSTNKKGSPQLSLNTAKFNSPEELAATIQKEISKKKKNAKDVLFPGITVTKENFRHQVPFSTSIEEKRKAILGMTASVYPNVAKRISLRYGLPKEVSASTLPQESAPGIAENVVATPVEEIIPVAKTKKAKKENDVKAAENSDFEAMKASRKKGTKSKKVVPKGEIFDEKSVESIQKFVAWVKKNLPEGIFSVDELSRLEDALNNNYVTAGQFIGFLDELKNIKGSIQVRDGSPFKYHEAFHGVFRLLLPQDKINDLLAQAKKENIATDKKLRELRNSDPIYKNLSEKELEERFYEEYLADKFDAWKMNRSTPAKGSIKSFFQKLADFIKELFAKITGNKLQAMFYELERGKYKKAGLQVNSFTDQIQEGVSDPALKLILLEEGFEIETENGIREVNRYLDQTTGDQLSTNIAALYHKMAMLEPVHNKKELLEKVLNIYKDTYDTTRPIYKSRANAITDVLKRAEWMRKLIDLETVFTEDSSRKSLMDAVDLHLQIMGYKQNLEDEVVASLEDEVGPRNTEDAHKKSKSPLSDYGSLSKYLREYIGSTTYQLDKDEFGNVSLIDGTPLYNTVSANKVYNGLLAILSNVADEDKLIDKLIEYTKHKGNPETVKFINRLFEDTGFDKDTKTATKNTLLLQQVLKGFNQYSTQYLFTQINQNHQFQTSYANTKDVARVQFSNWKAQYDSLKNVKKFGVTRLVNKMANNESKISDSDLDDFSESMSISLEKETGIALHQMFIKFSIIASKKEEARTVEQQKFYDLYSNVEPIATSALVANLETPLGNIDIFAKDADTEEGEKVNTSKPHQFLMKIAASNALFDESINTISFTNANNETVYAHQLPNFDFVKVRELNDKNVRQTLMENPEFANFLLSDPRFVTVANRNKISVEQIDGLRKVFESTNDETGESFVSKGLEVNRQPGITYGDFNKREFLATLLGLYDVRLQPDALVRNDNNTQSWYVVPVMTRTIEAKNSAHSIRMAVIPSVTKTKGAVSLSTEALDKLYSFIENEFNNIKQAKKEIEEIDNGTYTGKTIKGYHTGKKNEDGTWKIAPRGLKFFNARVSLGSLAEEIENNIDAELDEVKIKKQLNDYWLSQADVLASQMALEGLINLKKEAGKIVKISNILAPNFIFEGYGKQELNDKMNIENNDPMFNLTQILVNDYINTVAINQLILGNEAKSFKDPIDQVKRMAGANAQGPSMSTSFVSKELGIEHDLKTIHHITYSDNEGVVRSSVSGNEIQGDDGQMYGTAKGLRYALFGFGKLTKIQADIITKLQEGVPVTEEEFFGAGGLKDKGAFNSLKLVYYNGSTYLKCSMIPLFREAVSVWDGNEWQPQVGKEAAHALLNKMEDYEDKNSTVVFAHPESVSKGLKQNIANSISDIDDSHFNPLESRFMRQQLENPSNKLTITDPSQAKQQIMSEQDPSTAVTFMGVETTIGKVRAAYMTDNAQRVKNNYKATANTIFTLKDALIELDESIKGKEFTAKMGAFFDTMKETLRATGADQQTLNFLETKDGKPVYNLNFPSTLEKFTSIFLNYFSKGSVAEKVPGHTLALVSGSLGMGDCIKKVISLDENGQPKEWEVIPRSEYLKNFRRYKDAKRWDDITARAFVGLKEGDIYLDSLRHNVPIYDKDGKIVGRFSEYMAPAHYKEEMNSVQKSMRDAFGIRIPSDDKHSYISLRKVDTLPVQYGSVGIFPHELVEISGADFDIDKMYLCIADTYLKQIDSKNGNPIYGRVAYGTAKTDDEKFDEYITWQSENNKAVKNAIKEYKLTTEGVISDILDADKSIIIVAFKKLGMPTTTKEFIAEGGEELNNGVLNNRSLAAKIAMQSNEEITKFNSTSTSTTPLLNLTEKLIKMFTAISEDENVAYDKKKGIVAILNVLKEAPTDVSSILGKAIAFDNNKQGSRNIGATANAIQVYSLNNQFKVDIEPKYRITIDGNTFGSFSHNKEWEAHEAEPVLYKSGKKKGEIKGYIIAGKEYSKKDFDENNIPKGAYTGTRIAANLGTLLNAMTDNAKERLAARLGLNITALGYVSNMVSTGVPLETAVLLVLQPAARRYFADIQKLEGSLKTKEEATSSKRKILAEKISTLDPKDDVNVGPDNFVTTQDLIDNIAQGGNKVTDAYVLKTIKLVETQSDTLASISKIQKLSQGLPSTWEDIDAMNTALNNLGIKLDGDRYVEMTAKELEEYKKENKVEIAVDVKDILLNQQKIIATNLKVLAQVQYLSKKVFIEKTPLFARLSEVVFGNMKKMSNIENSEFGKTLKHDIISFLSIKAYRHWLQKNDYPGTLSSLTNAMIYPELKSQKPVDFKDIIDTMQSLRDKLKGKNENYLVSRFLMLVSAENSKEGINTAEANTWARLSDAQQDRLVSSFISLYVNAYEDESGNEINTHDDAVAMFNYLLVKDGAQFKTGSFIRFIPTFMFEDIMGRTTEVNDFLAADKWDEEKAMSIFGVPSSNIMDEFMRSYATHIGNKFYIKNIIDKKNVATMDDIDLTELTDDERKKVLEHILTKQYTKPVDINPNEQPLIYIDMFRGIRDTVVPDMEGTYVNRKYGKKFTDFENALLTKNKNYVKSTGFKIVRKEIKGKEGKEHDVIEFPYSISINGQLYELFALGESMENAPTKVITRDVSVATGTSAQYRKTEWKGAPSTFKASAIDGPLPNSKIQVGKKTKTVIEEEGEVTDEYLAQIEAEQTAKQSTKTPEERLAEFGIVRIATSKGFVAVKGNKQYLLNADENTPAKIIARVQTEETKQAVSLQPIDWKSEIDKLSEGKSEGWVEKARNVYTRGITAKLSPETILDNIKNC